MPTKALMSKESVTRVKKTIPVKKEAKTVTEPVIKKAVKKETKKEVKEVKKDADKVVKTDVKEEVVVDEQQPTEGGEKNVIAIKNHFDIECYKTYFTDVYTKQAQVNSLQVAIKNDLKMIEKKINRDLKAANKILMKRKQKAGNRKPSGFIKPTRISDELANFLEKEIGTEMARTEVTREINKYIVKHKLQDPDNGRKIVPDAKFTKLLKYDKNAGEVLTYFNLQRYMSPHFAKSKPKE
jgi:chromatin remodeling complex protein RSC6